MPGKARIEEPDPSNHVIFPGIEWLDIFRDDTHKNRFVDRLGKLLVETATPRFDEALIPTEVSRNLS